MIASSVLFSSSGCSSGVSVGGCRLSRLLLPPAHVTTRHGGRRTVFAAADSSSGAEAVDDEGLVEESSEIGGEGSEVQEARPPRKPRVKLGDIMGVTSFYSLLLF